MIYIPLHRSRIYFLLEIAKLFFRAHAFEEAFRKDRGCSAEKGTAKKGEGEQRHKEKRSPLPPRRETVTRSHRTCTQICGQILDEESEIFAEGRGNHDRKVVR